MIEHSSPRYLTPRFYPDTSKAYLEVLSEVLHNPLFECAPRGLKVKEILDVSFSVLNPSDEPIKTLDQERNAVIEAYTAKEFALYASMTNRGEDFAAAAKFWGGLTNPDGTVNSAYGKLIFSDKSCGNPAFEVPEAAALLEIALTDSTSTKVSELEFRRACDSIDTVMRTPWEWAKHCLVKDRDTRQAILHFNRGDHCWVGNKDVVCTMHGQFFIRGNKLIFSTVMRSQDVVRGLVYDMPWFCYLLLRMLAELRAGAYPGLELGYYSHHAHSMHVYERDWVASSKMLGVYVSA